MKRFLVGLTIVASTLVCCRYASAWGGRHGTETVSFKDRQLADLANRPDRVDGYWLNGHDRFYFVGNTEALNDFLHQYGQLKETPLVLVIHPGKAPADGSFPKGGLSYDWRFLMLDRAAPRSKEIFCKPGGGQWPRVAIVEAWLGGNVRLDELKVPADIEVREVRPGGDIEAFIKEHNKQRKDRALEAPDQ